jgi:hypothetical protein
MTLARCAGHRPIIMSDFRDSNWKTRLVRGEFPDRTFDIEFWQAQGDEAIFAAAWEMVELAEEIKNAENPHYKELLQLLNEGFSVVSIPTAASPADRATR